MLGPLASLDFSRSSDEAPRLFGLAQPVDDSTHAAIAARPDSLDGPGGWRFREICMGRILLRQNPKRTHAAGLHASSPLLFAMVRDTNN